MKVQLKALSPIRLANGKTEREHVTAQKGDFFLCTEAEAAEYKRLGVATELTADDLIRNPEARKQLEVLAAAMAKAEAAQ